MVEFMKKHWKPICIVVLVTMLTIFSLGLYKRFKKD